MIRTFARSAALARTSPSIQSQACKQTGLASIAPLQARGLATPTATGPNDHVKQPALFDVSHITAVVSGGGSGLGLMITQALCANGAKVYITGRRPDALSRVVELYNSGPGQIIALPGDISSKAEVQRLAHEIGEKEPNGIQLLVNNAGVALDHHTRYSINGKPDLSSPSAISDHFLRAEEDEWANTFRTNVTAQFYMSMAFLPLLARGQEQFKPADVSGEDPIQTSNASGASLAGYTSSVVNVSSISGAMKGNSQGQFSYAASKAAFTHLGRMLATTFADTKVRVNTIAPGVFPSEMTAGSSNADQKSALDQRSSNPAGRKGKDSDMAASILFLVGRGGSFYNHQILYPDGGNTFAEPAAM